MAIGKGTDVEYVGQSASGGVCIGQSSTEKVGFYGTTPVVRPSITAVATATATTALNETKINRLYAALRSIGIIDTGG
jgi:hypothetical protein